jgi:hypothetical protein
VRLSFLPALLVTLTSNSRQTTFVYARSDSALRAALFRLPVEADMTSTDFLFGIPPPPSLTPPATLRLAELDVNPPKEGGGDEIAAEANDLVSGVFESMMDCRRLTIE